MAHNIYRVITAMGEQVDGYNKREAMRVARAEAREAAGTGQPVLLVTLVMAGSRSCPDAYQIRRESEVVS